MGVDLTLLPITENEEKTWGHAHTLLNCARDYTLHDLLRALPSEPVPADFATYLAYIPDGTMEGEHCYGTVTHDAYDKPLRCVRAGAITKQPAIRRRMQANLQSRNHAVYAYLAALPPDTRVALYWD